MLPSAKGLDRNSLMSSMGAGARDSTKYSVTSATTASVIEPSTKGLVQPVG